MPLTSMNMWLHQDSLTSAQVRMQELQPHHLSLVGSAGKTYSLVSHCFILSPSCHVPWSFRNNLDIQMFSLALYCPGSLSDAEMASGWNKGKLF